MFKLVLYNHSVDDHNNLSTTVTDKISYRKGLINFCHYDYWNVFAIIVAYEYVFVRNICFLNHRYVIATVHIVFPVLTM